MTTIHIYIDNELHRIADDEDGLNENWLPETPDSADLLNRYFEDNDIPLKAILEESGGLSLGGGNSDGPSLGGINIAVSIKRIPHATKRVGSVAIYPRVRGKGINDFYDNNSPDVNASIFSPTYINFDNPSKNATLGAVVPASWKSQLGGYYPREYYPNLEIDLSEDTFPYQIPIDNMVRFGVDPRKYAINLTIKTTTPRLFEITLSAETSRPSELINSDHIGYGSDSNSNGTEYDIRVGFVDTNTGNSTNSIRSDSSGWATGWISNTESYNALLIVDESVEKGYINIWAPPPQSFMYFQPISGTDNTTQQFNISRDNGSHTLPDGEYKRGLSSYYFPSTASFDRVYLFTRTGGVENSVIATHTSISDGQFNIGSTMDRTVKSTRDGWFYIFVPQNKRLNAMFEMDLETGVNFTLMRSYAPTQVNITDMQSLLPYAVNGLVYANTGGYYNIPVERSNVLTGTFPGSFDRYLYSNCTIDLRASSGSTKVWFRATNTLTSENFYLSETIYMAAYSESTVLDFLLNGTPLVEAGRVDDIQENTDTSIDLPGGVRYLFRFKCSLSEIAPANISWYVGLSIGEHWFDRSTVYDLRSHEGTSTYNVTSEDIVAGPGIAYGQDSLRPYAIYLLFEGTGVDRTYNIDELTSGYSMQITHYTGYTGGTSDNLVKTHDYQYGITTNKIMIAANGNTLVMIRPKSTSTTGNYSLTITKDEA